MTFQAMMLATSILTGLTVEGLKKILDEKGKTYHSNILAGITAVILSVFIYAGYVCIEGIELSAESVVYAAVLILLSWLCAMVGYDKVIQTLEQIGSTGS